jgi:hypothetical protein
LNITTEKTTSSHFIRTASRRSALGCGTTFSAT